MTQAESKRARHDTEESASASSSRGYQISEGWTEVPPQEPPAPRYAQAPPQPVSKTRRQLKQEKEDRKERARLKNKKTVYDYTTDEDRKRAEESDSSNSIRYDRNGNRFEDDEIQDNLEIRKFQRKMKRQQQQRKLQKRIEEGHDPEVPVDYDYNSEE